PTAYNGRTYTWNTRGQLTGYTLPGTSLSFSYGGTGNRLSTTLNGTTTTTAFDGFSPTINTTGGTSTYVLNGPNFGSPIQVGNVFTATMGNGSTSKLTDVNGNVMGTVSYNPFGYPT